MIPSHVGATPAIREHSDSAGLYAPGDIGAMAHAIRGSYIGLVNFSTNAASPSLVPAPSNYQAISLTGPWYEAQDYLIDVAIDNADFAGEPGKWQLFSTEGALHTLRNSVVNIDVRTAIGSDVLARFSRLSQVVAIYQDDTDPGTTFWVFTSNDRYDEKLIETLIEEEKRVLALHLRESVEFIYLPAPAVDDARTATGSTARLIFKK